jgi:hypothetical protein
VSGSGWEDFGLCRLIVSLAKCLFFFLARTGMRNEKPEEHVESGGVLALHGHLGQRRRTSYGGCLEMDL